MDDQEITIQVPREMRTPTTEAGESLNVAWDFFVGLAGRIQAANPSLKTELLSDPEKYFASNIFNVAWDNPDTCGDKAVDEIGLSLHGERDPISAPFALIQTMSAVVNYAVQAIKAEKGGRRDQAWTYVADARYWSGILRAAWTEKIHGENPAVELARKRHTENYAMADDALKYWKEHIDPNISAAKAANVLMGVVPLSHKKLSEIVSAEKKKQK